MRSFNLERVLPLNVQQFFDQFLKDNSFKKLSHEIKGDKAVDVSDWMDVLPGQKRRICFYTMIENEGKNELERTRCMETQTVKLKEETTEEDITHLEEIELESGIVPENPMGSALFKIDSKWKVTPIQRAGSTAEGCKLSILITVECMKRIWGVTGMVESLLEKQAQLSYSKLFALIEEQSEHYLQKASAESDNNSHNLPREEVLVQGFSDNMEESSNLILNRNTTSPMRLRLSTFKRVVSGTEKLVQMLNSIPLPQNDEFATRTTSQQQQQQQNSNSFDPAHVTSSHNNANIYSNPTHNYNVFQPNALCGPSTVDDHDDADLLPTGRQRQRWRWQLNSPKVIIGVIIITFFLFWLYLRSDHIVTS